MRVEVRSAHVCGTNVGLEIRLRLVSAEDVGTEGKPCREVMRKRCCHAQVFILRAQIQKLGKPSDSMQKKVCWLPR